MHLVEQIKAKAKKNLQTVVLPESYDERMLFAAQQVVEHARSLGLGDYTITQGLAAKVFMPPEASAARDTVYIQGDGWLDLTRTDSLWKVVFKGPQSVINTGDWIDRPSVGIPYLYVATGVELAQELRLRGKTADAASVFATAKKIASGTSSAYRYRPWIANHVVCPGTWWRFARHARGRYSR